MAHDFDVLDVFTDQPLTGNPLAVVHDAGDLDAAAMQAIAREFNLSETVFVTAPANPAHSARIRIFTPDRELPFAGHPSVGTAILLAERMYGTDAEHEAITVLEEEIGPVRVGVVIRPGEASYAEFDLPKMPEELAPPREREAVARALGLVGSDIGFDNHRPTNFSAGVPFGFVPVRDAAALSRAEPFPALWKGAGFGDAAHSGVFVYARGPGGPAHAFAARMFAPDLGIMEDPATGAAAAAFAGVVARFESLATGLHVLPIEQGADMGRRSLMALEVELASGRLKSARIGGRAVKVASGRLLI